MLSEMTASDLMGWQVHFSIEPFTIERQEVAMGLIGMHNASMHVDKKVALKDYMMNYTDKPKSKQMSQDEIRRNLMMFKDMHNGSRNGK